MTADHIIHHGQKYERHPFSSEAELEKLVTLRHQDIFGKDTIYVNNKILLKQTDQITEYIPDGFLIKKSKLGISLHLVEIEHSNHDAFSHIYGQIQKFKDVSLPSRIKLRDVIYKHLNNNKLLQYSTNLKQKKDLFQVLDNELLNPSKIIPIIVIIDDVRAKHKSAFKKLLSEKVSILELKRYIHGGKTTFKLLHLDKTAEWKLTDINETDTHPYNYIVQTITVELIYLKKNVYIYNQECSYLPLRISSPPITYNISSFDKNAKIIPLHVKGYEITEQKTNEIAFSSNFKGPFKIDSALQTKISLKITSESFPPHLSHFTHSPIHGPLIYKLNFKKMKNSPDRVVLMDFPSLTASRPVNTATLSPSKDFDNNQQLLWEINKPKQHHLYFLSWSLDCKCAFCISKHFD